MGDHVTEGPNNLIDLGWPFLIPGLSITVVVVAITMFSDWLRVILEPKLRRS